MKPLRNLGACWRRLLACACLIVAGLIVAAPGRAQPAPGALLLPPEAAALPQAAATRWITLRSNARDLALTPDGDVLALDEAGAVWRLSVQSVRDGSLDAWALQPGRFARLRATLDGTLWGIDASAVLYRLVGSVWRPLAEGVRDVATTPDGVVMLLTTDKRLLYPDLQQVLALPADAAAPDRLVADEHGQPWLHHADGRVSRWTGRRWATVATAAEGLRDIAISADGTVLAVAANGALLQRLPQGGAWQAYGRQGGLPGAPPASALRVVLDARGLPWLLDATGSLHAERLVAERSAALPRLPSLFTRLLAWRPLGGLASGVALGPDGSAFSLTREGSVYQWLGENRWSAKGGNFQSIAVGAKGSVWGLDARGVVHALDQGFWLPLPLEARHIAAGPSNSLWAAMPDDSLMRWNPAARQWALVLPLPEKVQSLAIGPGGEPWVIDATGTVQFMQGREWKAVAGITVAGLSVGPEGTVYAIDAADQSLQWLDKRDLQWRPASGQAMALAVGAEGALWIVAPGNTLMASGRFLREEAERQEAQRLATATPPVPVLTITPGVLPTLQKVLNFQTVQMPNMVFQDIGIGANGAVFALGSEGGLFCFSNASRQFQLATLSKARRVAVSPAGQPWLLNQSGVVSSFNKGVWRTVPEFLGRDIAVGPDGQAWSVDLQGAAFRYSTSSNRFERMSVQSSDAPNKATRIAGAAGSVYWTVTESNQLMRCERGDCRIQLLGVQDVTVAPDSTVLVLDLLGSVRRFNPTTRQFEKQNGLGRSIAAGPQGLPWLVTADGKISYAGLFFPGSRSINTEACAAAFSQTPAPIEPPSATLRLADVTAALVPGTSVDLLQQGRLNGRPLALAEVSLALNSRTPWLSLQQGSVVLAANAPAGSLLDATYTVCPLRQAGTCVTARLAVSVGGAPAAPTAVQAVAGDGRASVSFVASANTGGSAVTAYTVTSSPGGITASGTASPITVTGLANGTAYTFSVVATNGLGRGTASAASNAVTPTAPAAPSTAPGAPTAVAASAGNAQAVVSFTAPASDGGSAITRYTVTSSPGGLTASGAASAITVSGLTNGTAYTFSVVATNAVGSGAASSASSAVTPVAPTTVPGAPTAVAATAGNAQASVSFTAPASNGGSAITGYTVTSSPGDLTASGTASPITVAGLDNGTAYTFTVRATNAAGSGAAGAASSAVTPVAPVAPSAVPGAPTAVTASAGNAQAVVSFTAPASNGGSAITGYTVTSSPGGATASGTASPITVAGLENGTAYTFSVVATNAVGSGAASAASSAVSPVAPTTVPGAPTAVAASAGNAQATVSFTAPASNGGSAITSYTVTSSPGGITASGAASPITLTGLTNGTAYTFTVRATSAAGSGAASAASSAVTPVAPVTVPGAPTAVAATAGNAQASVSFTAPASNGGSAITGYTVTSSPGGVTGSGGASPISVAGLTNGTAYTFSVVATNAVGSGAASSATNAVTPVAPTTVPGSPTGAAATAGNAQAVVSFTAPASNGGSAITGYTVTSSPGGITASGAASPITVAGLTNGTAYTFSVVATNAVGNGAASAASSAVTPVAPAMAPGAPTAVAATAGNAQASVSFTAPASNGGSAITSYTVTSSPGGITVSGTASPISVAGLTNGTAYTFTVVATNAVGSGTASSASSAVTPAAPVTAPGAPTAVAATAGNAQASVSFTAPANNGGSAITGYTVTSSPGGITANGTASPIAVAGLNNGTAYTFTVQASNAVGTGAASAASSAVTPVAPVTAPGAPTATAATAGNAQAVVSFTAPASDGGSAITGYTVTSSPGGLTASGTASPIAVAGLTNGTAYTFSVVATNAVGNGAASAASAAVTPFTVPGQPQGVVATPPASSPNVWRISFEAPASNGGSAITAYTVTLFDASGTARASAVGSGSSLFVDVNLDGTSVCPAGLGAGFYFSVRATNAAGDGAAATSAPRSSGYECFP